jgi:PAS domain S-box-containing protein
MPRATSESSAVLDGSPRNFFLRIEELERKVAVLEAENRALRAEGELLSSDARFRQVIDASPVPLSVDDMKGTIEYVNRSFEQKFGYSHAEVPTSAAWFAHAYPNPAYRAQVAEEWKAFVDAGVKHGREIGPLEVEIACKDSSVRRVEFLGTLLGSRLLIAARDITERKRLEKEILEISEQEQERIGQDLHDGLCQLLSGTKFKTTLLEQKLQAKAPAEAREARALESLLNQAIEQARDIARGLHPVDLEARGLMSALEELASSVSNVYGITCACKFPQPVLIHNHHIAKHLYRIAQEAINNAVRHGEASRIFVQLTADPDRYVLTIRDNGVGIGVRPKRKRGGMGLQLMNYRARTIGAALTFQTDPKGGTTVTCDLRLTAARKATESHARPSTFQ